MASSALTEEQEKVLILGLFAMLAAGSTTEERKAMQNIHDGGYYRIDTHGTITDLDRLHVIRVDGVEGNIWREGNHYVARCGEEQDRFTTADEAFRMLVRCWARRHDSRVFAQSAA